MARSSVDPFFGDLAIGVLCALAFGIVALLWSRKRGARAELTEEPDRGTLEGRADWLSWWWYRRRISRWEIIAWLVVFALIAVVVPAISPRPRLRARRALRIRRPDRVSTEALRTVFTARRREADISREHVLVARLHNRSANRKIPAGPLVIGAPAESRTAAPPHSSPRICHAWRNR